MPPGEGLLVIGACMATPTSWPHAREYLDAVQTPKLCFSDPRLKDASIHMNSMGMPLTASGKSAIVFKATADGKDVAIRCFTRAASDQRMRYLALQKHLDPRPSYLVGFGYRDDEIRVGNTSYPLVEMDWVDGDPLDAWVGHHLRRNGDLGVQAEAWRDIVGDMLSRKMAHGDIANDNCMVSGSQLKLVDYDGCYIPALRDKNPGESGAQDFQHPDRGGYYADNMDAFPSLVVYLSLAALHADPSLWARYHKDKNLIFSAADYRAPRATPIWRDLASNPDPAVRRLAAALADMCDASVDSLPPLDSLPRLSQVSGTTILPLLLAGATADTVPEPGDGRVKAADRLNLAAEIEMLVSVLLAYDTRPPLAIGLFGDWGSGKSFFMSLMSERIDELAGLAAEGRPEAAPFCQQVRQVRFNAWHYADANLWASLAATLFDELARADAPDRAQATLAALDEARGEARDARQRCKELEREVQTLEVGASRAAAVIRGSVSVAIQAVRDKPVIKCLKDAGTESAVDADTSRLVTALGEIDTAAGKISAAARLFQEEALHRRRWATWITLVLLVGLTVAASVVASWPAGLKILAFAGAVAAGLSPALSGAMRILYLAREAREARELPLVRKKEELAQARAEVDRAEQGVVQCEQELAEIRDPGLQLRNFVRERAASSDYRDKLGVISQVRRDFEHLLAMIPGSLAAGTPEAAASDAVATERIPNVDRIVLFIDDLDRCPPDKVVEVLQAVHLLLAFELFVVVVGVDSRWLERSLQEHYPNVLMEPERYLEKIFQIPFALQRMTGAGYRGLIDELTPQGQPDQPLQLADAGEDVFADGDGTSARIDAATDTAPERPKPNSEITKPAEPKLLPRPEALVITDPERAMLGQLGVLVQTPRAAKRLVNIYRMLRVSVPLDEMEKFRPGGGDEYQAVALLVGIMVGRPSQARSVFTELMAADDDSDVRQVLARFDDLRHPLALIGELQVTKISSYRRWVPRVSRFTFQLTTASPLDQTVSVTVVNRRCE